MKNLSGIKHKIWVYIRNQKIFKPKSKLYVSKYITIFMKKNVESKLLN